MNRPFREGYVREFETGGLFAWARNIALCFGACIYMKVGVQLSMSSGLKRHVHVYRCVYMRNG